MSSASAPEPALRADARRNREQVIAAAREIFVSSGLDVPMEAIARRAGVGVGTLYRRFPDRSQLIAAVAAEGFRALIDEARSTVETSTSAWEAFVDLVTTSEALRLTVHLAFLSPQSWRAVHDEPESRGVHAEMMSALDQLVRDAQAEGSIRADIGAGDALGLISVVLGTRPADSDPIGQERTDRSIRVILDGLRATHEGGLPGAPVTVDDLNGHIERSADA